MFTATDSTGMFVLTLFVDYQKTFDHLNNNICGGGGDDDDDDDDDDNYIPKLHFVFITSLIISFWGLSWQLVLVLSQVDLQSCAYKLIMLTV